MGFTKEYWEENRERILEERRKKYAADPALREDAKERARKWREERKAERDAQFPPNAVSIHGEWVPAYSLEEAAERLGILPYRIKYYHRKSYIPRTFRTRPRRLYTDNQIGQIKRLVNFLEDNAVDLRRPTTPAGEAATAALEDLVNSIKENWEA